MTAITLRRIALLLEDRLTRPEERLYQDDATAWPDYLAAVSTYAHVVAQLSPDRFGEFLTTRAMAEKLNVSPRTLLNRKRKGQVTPAVQLGKRGRGAIRWRGTEAAR
jgi:hypothetical protein